MDANDNLNVEWGNYPRGRSVHPAQVTTWQRARRGDRIVTAMIDSGRRFFVMAENPTIGVRMPIGTTIKFDQPISCSSGYGPNGMRAPDGWIKRREVRYGHFKTPGATEKLVTRPVIAPLSKMWPILLGHVRTAQCATILHLPRRKKVTL